MILLLLLIFGLLSTIFGNKAPPTVGQIITVLFCGLLEAMLELAVIGLAKYVFS